MVGIKNFDNSDYTMFVVNKKQFTIKLFRYVSQRIINRNVGNLFDRWTSFSLKDVKKLFILSVKRYQKQLAFVSFTELKSFLGKLSVFQPRSRS